MLTIEILDGKALFYFKDSKITKAFTEGQLKDGVHSIYSEELKKCLCTFPNMSQQEIAANIKDNLKRLNAQMKNG